LAEKSPKNGNPAEMSLTTTAARAGGRQIGAKESGEQNSEAIDGVRR
jgi:hypothetical protein